MAVSLLIAQTASPVAGQDFVCAPEWVAKQTGYNQASDFDCNKDTKMDCLLAHCCWDESVEGIPPCTKKVAPDAPITVTTIVSHQLATTGPQYDEQDGKLQWAHAVVGEIPQLHDRNYEDWVELDVSMGAYAIMIDAGTYRTKRMEGFFIHNHGNVKDVEIHTCRSSLPSSCTNNALVCRGNKHNWLSNPKCKFWHKGKNRKQEETSQFWMVKIVAEDKSQKVKVSEIEFFSDVVAKIEGEGQCLWEDKIKNRATVNIDELTGVSCPDTGCSAAACKEVCALNTKCYGFSYDSNDNTCSFKGEAMDNIEKVSKNTGQGACEALLFEHGNFDGKKGSFLMGPKDSAYDFPHNTFKELMPNDALSSMSVSEGCGVTIYQHDIGGGWSASFPFGDWNGDTFGGQGAHHDDASSMRIYHNYASPGCDDGECQKYSKTWTFGSKVALRSTSTNKYCMDKGDEIICDAGAIGTWETFTMMDGTRLDWSDKVDEDRIGIVGGHHNKMCADEDDKLRCNRGTIGTWEAFYVEHTLKDRKIKIKSSKNNRYCGMNDNRIKCNRDNNEEEFIVECLEHCIILPEPAYCFTVDFQYDPVDNVEGQGRTQESGPEACAERCKNVQDCQYFSFWPDGGCHLSDVTAVLKESKGIIAGPGSTCPQEKDGLNVDKEAGVVTDALVKADGVDTYLSECEDPKACKNMLQSSETLRAGEYIQQGLATAYIQLDGAFVLAWNGIVVMETETVDPTVFQSIWLWECPAYDDLQLLPSCKSASVGSLCTGKDDDKTDGWGKLPWHQHVAKHWEAFGDIFDTRCANIWNIFDPWVLVYRMDHVSENYLKFDTEKGEVLVMDGEGWSQWYWDAGTKDDWSGCANPGTEYDLVVADECPADKGAAEALPECKDVTEIGALCRGDGTCGTDQCGGKCHNCNYDLPGIGHDVWDFFTHSNRFDLYKVVAIGEVGGMQIGSNGHLQIVANGQQLASTSDNDYTELITHSAIALVGFAGLGLGIAGMLAGGAVAFSTVGIVAAGVGVVTAAIIPAVIFAPGLALVVTATVGGVAATAFAGTAFAGGLLMGTGAAITASYASAAFWLVSPLWMYFGPMISVYAVAIAVPLAAVTAAPLTLAGAGLMTTLIGGTVITSGMVVATGVVSATVAGGAAVATGAAAVSASVIGMGTAMGGVAIAAGSATMAGVFTTSAVLIMEKMMEENDFSPGDCGTVSRTGATLPLPDKCFYQDAQYRVGSTMKEGDMAAVGLAEAMMTEQGALSVWHNGDEVWNSGEFGEGAYTEVHRDRIQLKSKDGATKWEQIVPDDKKVESGCPKIEWVNQCPSEDTLRNLGSCKLGVDTHMHNVGDYCHSYHSDDCGIDWWQHTFGSANCGYCDYTTWCHPWWTWGQGWHDVCHTHCWWKESKVYKVIAEPEAKLFMDIDGALKFTYGDAIGWQAGGSFYTGEGCTRNEVLANSLPKQGDYAEKASATKLYQLIRQRGALNAVAMIGLCVAIIQSAFMLQRRRNRLDGEDLSTEDRNIVRTVYDPIPEEQL